MYIGVGTTLVRGKQLQQLRLMTPAAATVPEWSCFEAMANMLETYYHYKHWVPIPGWVLSPVNVYITMEITVFNGKKKTTHGHFQ